MLVDTVRCREGFVQGDELVFVSAVVSQALAWLIFKLGELNGSLLFEISKVFFGAARGIRKSTRPEPG